MQPQPHQTRASETGGFTSFSGILICETSVRRFTTQIDTFRRKEVLERDIALRASGLP